MHSVKQCGCILQAARCVPINCTAQKWKKLYYMDGGSLTAEDQTAEPDAKQ